MKKRIAAVLLVLMALSAGADQAKTSYVCSLTNKKISKCCCTMKNGQQYCTLAKKTIKECCCKVVK